MISDIPWGGPVGAVRVAHVDGQFIANPTFKEIDASDLDLRQAQSQVEAARVNVAAFTGAVAVGRNALLAYILPGILGNLFAVIGLPGVLWPCDSGWPGALNAGALTAGTALAREQGVPVHIDGARRDEALFTPNRF